MTLSSTGDIQEFEEDDIIDVSDKLNEYKLEDEDECFQTNLFPDVCNDLDSSFTVEMHEAHCFRSLIDVLGLTSRIGIFRFSDDSIRYTMGGNNMTVINDLVIETSELEYTFESRFPEIFFMCDLRTFKEAMLGIGKTENMLMYKQSGNLSIFINPRSKSARVPQNIVKFVHPFPIEEWTTYEIPTYSADDRHPNCKISSQDFSRTCSTFAGFKRPHVTLTGFPKGIVFTVYGPDGKTLGITTFGKTPGNTEVSSELEEVTRVEVLSTNLKNLSRWNNLHPNSLIKIFMEAGKPLKIICSVGGFGKLTQYISNQSSNVDSSSSSKMTKPKTRTKSKPSN